MNTREYRVIRDPVYGYRRLDPLPDPDEIRRFYETQYYSLVRQGGRAPELRRLLEGGAEGASEREWLRATLYADIRHVLGRYPVKRVLDVGCGTGDLLSFLQEVGYEVMGIEPSPDAAALAKARDLVVYTSTLSEFVETYRSNRMPPFDSVILINVLEHTADPVGMLELVRLVLKPSGITCIRAPNDFNALQIVARERLGKTPWWIAQPDHINYFDFQSLSALLGGLGFEVIYSQADFPMELFLLMDEDYVGNPDVGARCHEKRVMFERAIPAELRRRIYAAFAEIGIGRDCLVFGKDTRR